jgi:hypothetical protein
VHLCIGDAEPNKILKFYLILILIKLKGTGICGMHGVFGILLNLTFFSQAEWLSEIFHPFFKFH